MNLYELAMAKKLAGGGGGGDEPVLIDKNIDANGTYNASSDSADGYKKVVVSVPQPSGSINITQNGTTDVTNYASAVVNVPSVSPTGNINITSMAQTDVSAYATAQVVDADLVAGNIKKDVNILGVTGTYEGGGGGGGTDEFADKLLKNTGEGQLVIPEGMTTIGDYALTYTNYTDIVFPSTLTTLTMSCFMNCKTSPLLKYTFKSTTPPSIYNSSLPNKSYFEAIYVPAESVNAYKTANRWSGWASVIQAIPE